MKKKVSLYGLRVVLTVSLLFSHSAAFAALNVLACEPEWAALAKQLGGELVKVNSATTAFQDPHHIQARPSLIAKARKADLLICSGAELEVGWLPVLLKKSGNPKIQNNALGQIMTTDYVELLGKHEKVSRSMGDVHGAGNPHVHLDPMRMLKIADVVAQRLAKIDAENAQQYQQNNQALQAELKAMLEQLQPKIAKLKGQRWVVHHDNWIYLNEWLGLVQTATLEPKPGIPPTTKHLASLIESLSSNPIAGIAYGSYQPKKAASWLSKKTDTPVIAMPYSIADWQSENAIALWYQSLINTLVDGFKL